MNNILKAENITKSYGDHSVLKGLSLSIKRGEIHSLLGANGAGKTTFIKIISTLLSKDGGSLEIDGMDIIKERYKIKKLIGYVGQDTDRSAYGRLSVYDNLMYFGRLQGIAKPDVHKSIMNYSKLFDAENNLQKSFMTLSGGQKQMTVIIRALLHDPMMVILDEPTKGLDPLVASKMRNFLKRLVRESGKTVLLTSHILSEVDYLSDRVSLMNDGRIVTTGTPDELVQMLNTEAFFELESSSVSETLVRRLDLSFGRKEYDVGGRIIYPLKNMCSDSIRIFKMINEHGGKAVFKYRHTSLEDVFLDKIDDFNEVFER